MAALTHDAVVIGAGPAGALASLHLARQGRRVLVLEKARAGRDKPCGGGLTVRSWRDLEVPIDDLVVGRVGTADLRCGPGRSVRVPLGAKEVLMVRRRDLDRRIGESAEQAGAELHHCEPAVAIEPGDGAAAAATAPRRCSSPPAPRRRCAPPSASPRPRARWRWPSSSRARRGGRPPPSAPSSSTTPSPGGTRGPSPRSVTRAGGTPASSPATPGSARSCAPASPASSTR
ncbi:MAG: FAD-binding protein [Chloroflexi bacterium]|nr:MAG: FAD-binding protein [Chloroflexota bacterium]